MEDKNKNTRETMTKHSVERFDYIAVKDCGYRLVAMPGGGKDGPPTQATFALYQDTFSDDGIPNGEELVSLLMDDCGTKLKHCAWVSAASRQGSARTWNAVEALAQKQFKYQLREGEGIPEKAKRPIAVRNLIALARQTLAIGRKCSTLDISIEDAVPMAKMIDPAMAPWINDDGSYKPPAEETAKKATKKAAKKK
jgi:hypothetical protein|tara:strand:- start:967 stop:1554 length:588 start_codon:yes stop_codon:yes gene_type:complete